MSMPLLPTVIAKEIASMTEVLQDEMQMSEAQNNYINAHYNYRVTNLMLLKTDRADRIISQIIRN